MAESPFKETVLKGKKALVTGGGSGIGFTISTELGKHGVVVAIMGRRKNFVQEAATNLQAQGIRAIRLEGDVRKVEDVTHVVKLTVKQLVRLDILVDGAASNFLSSPEYISQNGFRTVLDADVDLWTTLRVPACNRDATTFMEVMARDWKRKNPLIASANY